MSSRDRSAAAIMALPNSGAFDDLGALVAALREMLSGAEPTALERGHAYCLACMAEDAWQRLNNAMQPGVGR